MKLKKLAAVLAAMMIIAVVGTGCGSEDTSSGSSDKVVIATQDLLNTSAIAKGENYFQELMGDNVSIEKFSSGRDINSALLSDSAQFGMFGICPTAVGLTSDSDFKIIWIECLIRGTEGLAVKNDSGISSVKDLKGKKVATTVASSGHYGLLCALKEEGMTVDDIELVDLDLDAIYSAWERGDIDAAYTWNPTLAKLEASDGTILLTGADMAEKGYQTINFHVVRSDFAEENPDMVKQYCASLAKGVDLYNEDPDTAMDTICDYLELTPDEVKEQMTDEYVALEDQLSDDAFGNDNAAQAVYQVAQFLEEQGQIEDAKDLEFFKNAIDTTYIEELLAEQE